MDSSIWTGFQNIAIDITATDPAATMNRRLFETLSNPTLQTRPDMNMGEANSAVDDITKKAKRVQFCLVPGASPVVREAHYRFLKADADCVAHGHGSMQVMMTS